jgi:hypothetical protein
MTEPPAQLPPSELVQDSARALAAVRRAVRRALLDHKRSGDPVVTVQDGQIRWVAADDIVIPDEEPV